MENRLLKYFLVVAREENITKAAEILHVSQPALSRQIMQLEEELGARLFIRGKRSLTLTEEGRFLRGRWIQFFQDQSQNCLVHKR